MRALMFQILTFWGFFYNLLCVNLRIFIFVDPTKNHVKTRPILPTVDIINKPVNKFKLVKKTCLPLQNNRNIELKKYQ